MTRRERFRRVLWLALVLVAGQCVLLAAPAAAALALAENGKARLVIVLSDKPGYETVAAGDLVRCLTKATGASFEQVAEKDVKGRPAIFVGATRAAAAAGVSTSGMDQHAFVIRARGGSLFIVGQDNQATATGVYFFLQRHVGVRWYTPLDIGEHIPSRPDLTVPDKLAEKPQASWPSRRWTGTNQAYNSLWDRRNLMRQRYTGDAHALLNVLRPSGCYDKHPEWFPLLGGKRVPKPPDGNQRWQPCFANQGMADYVARKAIQFLNDHPERADYPLGINDSGADGYCQCPACQAFDDPAKLTFRGRPNYSNRVFTFMNRVAEIVSRKHPDKFLGCLAYDNCEEVPGFPVHPMIMPYLTNDRAHWWNKEFKAEDQDLLRRWGKAVPQLGIYDYYNGSSYVVPRIFLGVSAEIAKFCHRVGVRAWYSGLYPIWGLDGCKPWLTSQLLWDVTQDPKELVDEYYTNFFGAARAPMKKYWDRAEELWMNQGGEARWFKGRYDIKQVDTFGFSPGVQRELRGYLNQAAKLADDDLTRRRVKLYSDGFRYTELHSRLYWADKRLRQILERSDSVGLAERNDDARVREALLNLILAQQELRQFFDTVVNQNPLLLNEAPFRTYTRWRYGEDLLLPAFARMADYYAKGGGSLQGRFRLSDQLPEDNPAARMYAAYITMRLRPETAPELLANPGFEVKPGVKAGLDVAAKPDWNFENCPPGWSTWSSPGAKAELRWVKEPVHSGKHAVMIKGPELNATYFSAVKVKPGDVLLFSVYAKVEQAAPRAVIPGQTAPEKGMLKIDWRDNKNKSFPAPTPSVPLPRDTGGAWQLVELISIVPEGVPWAWPFLFGSRMAPDDAVYFDDCSFRKLETK